MARTWRSRSDVDASGAGTADDHADGLGDDRQICAQRDLVEVGEIVVEALVQWDVVGSSGDLPGAGEAGANAVPIVFAQAEAIDHGREFGTWADEAHLASDDMDELGEFVEAGLPQEAPDLRVAWVGSGLVGLAAFRPVVSGGVGEPTARPHRAELHHAEVLAVAAHTGLVEDDVLAKGDPEHEGDRREEWQRHDEGGRSDDGVEAPFQATLVEAGRVGDEMEVGYSEYFPCVDQVFVLLHAYRPPPRN